MAGVHFGILIQTSCCQRHCTDALLDTRLSLYFFSKIEWCESRIHRPDVIRLVEAGKSVRPVQAAKSKSGWNALDCEKFG